MVATIIMKFLMLGVPGAINLFSLNLSLENLPKKNTGHSGPTVTFSHALLQTSF